MWNVPVPLKVRIHMWICVKGRLNTRKNLLRKGVIVNPYCILCNNSIIEDMGHLFFECPYSKSLWRSIGHNFHLKTLPCHVSDLWNDWSDINVPRGSSLEWNMYVMAILWVIWRERNLRIFEDKIRHSLQLLEIINSTVFFWVGNISGKKKLIIEKASFCGAAGQKFKDQLKGGSVGSSKKRSYAASQNSDKTGQAGHGQSSGAGQAGRGAGPKRQRIDPTYQAPSQVLMNFTDSIVGRVMRKNRRHWTPLQPQNYGTVEDGVIVNAVPISAIEPNGVETVYID